MCIQMDGTQKPIPADCELIADNTISRVYFSQEMQFVYKRSIPYLTENEYWALLQLQGRFAPEIVSRFDKYTICMRYVNSTPVTNRTLFMRNCRNAVEWFKNKGLKHGDITPPNVIVSKNCPIVLDWAESRITADMRASKRAGSDMDWMMMTADDILERDNAIAGNS